jgi:hypothetical protein
MSVSEYPSVDKIKYQSGFGNEFATEALEGALPEGEFYVSKFLIEFLWVVGWFVGQVSAMLGVVLY